MIAAEFKQRKGTGIVEFSIKGHSGYSERGSDIVCAAVSSAAYMACGMAEESGEPVVLTCTGATAARNYMPGLTEAFYRKLPLLVVTGTQDLRR